MNEKAFDKKFNVFGECNPPRCNNMVWRGNFKELKNFLQNEREELLQIVTEDVPWKYQKRLLEKLSR